MPFVNITEVSPELAETEPPHVLVIVGEEATNKPRGRLFVRLSPDKATFASLFVIVNLKKDFTGLSVAL